ncbi:MAG: hypothetical protein AAFN50_08275 [Pseudomonadota bacterium]
MNNKLKAALAAVLLVFSSAVMAESYVQVLTCKLNDGMTKEDAHELNAKWLTWARGIAGTDDIQSSFASTVVGDLGGFSWVDSYPSLTAWAAVAEADEDEELVEAFGELAKCTKSSLINLDPTKAGK